ncbi:MAG TPA: cytochrome C' [Burkholderiaceae bacterium]|nr:cytochrome C' [Burkholderiaceae bacterium]HQR72214.1 cytochrome C' [Burkholderiaceae bacterium]
MKSKIAIAVAAAALLTTGVAQASADLADKSGCNKCHAMDTKKMGPSYKDIAAKTKNTPDADLVKKLATGTGHPKATASEADLTAIVKWIKSL